MAGNGRLACAWFAAGVVVGGALAWVAFLLLRHHGAGVLRDLHGTLPSWVTVLLGSSVLVTFATAYFNYRTARRSRTDSLSDSAYTAYLGFNGAARKLLDDFERFTEGRPATDQLKMEYNNAHALLSRLSGKSKPQLGLLDTAFQHLEDWPIGKAGKPSNSGCYAATARERLNGLEESMRRLKGGAA
jgi:hypothetical protein